MSSSRECGVLLENITSSTHLAISVWEVYSTSVVLDWYITLLEKFR